MRRALSRMEDPRFQRVRDIIERVADNEKAFTRS